MSNDGQKLKAKYEEMKRKELEQRELNQRSEARTKQKAHISDSADSYTFELNEEGKKSDHWSRAVQKADRILGEAGSTVNDYRNSMQTLMLLGDDLRKAARGTFVKRIVAPILEKGAGAVQAVYDYVQDSKMKKAPIDLSTLQYKVNFTDDNKLKVDSLIRGDKEADVGPLNPLFKGLVNAWLKDCGYIPKGNDGQYETEKPPKTPLTKAEFENLKQGFRVDPGTKVKSQVMKHGTNDPVKPLADVLPSEAPGVSFESSDRPAL